MVGEVYKIFRRVVFPLLLVLTGNIIRIAFSRQLSFVNNSILLLTAIMTTGYIVMIEIVGQDN